MHKVNSKGLLRKMAVASLLITGLLGAKAQSIVIPIETKQNAIVLQVSPEKYLNMVYFGNKLANKTEYNSVADEYRLEGKTDGYNSAYTTAGTRNLLEPAIAVTHADGNKSLDLKYVSHTVTKIGDDIGLTSINLKDSVYDFVVTLNYQTYFNENVTEQWRSYSALWCPALAGIEFPLAVASRFEHRLNQTQHSAIGYPLGDKC